MWHTLFSFSLGSFFFSDVNTPGLLKINITFSEVSNCTFILSLQKALLPFHIAGESTILLDVGSGIVWMTLTSFSKFLSCCILFAKPFLGNPNPLCHYWLLQTIYPKFLKWLTWNMSCQWYGCCYNIPPIFCDIDHSDYDWSNLAVVSNPLCLSGGLGKLVYPHLEDNSRHWSCT